MCDFAGSWDRKPTHRDEHDDRQGVVHGVPAHSPPRQTHHLRAQHCQLVLIERWERTQPCPLQLQEVTPATPVLLCLGPQ